MKRLKKKAFESIELYHHTSSQMFAQMIEDGQVTPGGYNNNISGGGHEKILDVANETDDRTNLNYPLEMLNEWIENPVDSPGTITNKLKNLVKQRQEENPENWEDEDIEVNVTSPSGNEIGVYLTKNKIDEYRYSSSAISNSKDYEMLNFGATLSIDVQTDALSPDYDDLDYFDMEIDEDDSTPLWKQSLDVLGQCVHNGPIDVSSITGVTFYDIKNSRYSDSKFSSVDEFEQFVNQYIQEGVTLSLSEAQNLLNTLNDEYINIDNLVMSSKNITRLKKLSRK